ncbi:MAG TPA: DUF4160 domain-containing protein [Micropepsaceae bacterium]|nr:DUF4160 domain-containing protein [Micropepsaceae bacterium]
MPTIAIFNGIIIQIFFEDHDPPHVHAIYGGAKALIRISDGQIIRGRLPKKQAALVKYWVELRHAELMENWHHAQTDGRCYRIAGPADD